MITFAVNGANDLHLDDRGNLAMSSGARALAEVATQYVRTLRGEPTFDVVRGMPNMTTVWRGVPNLPQYEAALRQRLLAVPGVRSIVSLASSRQGEIFSYTATLRTDFGDVPVNG